MLAADAAADGPSASPQAADDLAWQRWIIPCLIGLALVAGLAVRLAVAWQELEELVTKALQDDSFYYFLTAQRITDGQGISFDGITASNGYHPLWLFFLVPFFLLPGRELPIHAALTGAAVLDVAAAGLVALAVRRLTGSTPAALFALFFYLFLPRNIFSAVNGLETSVTTFMLASLLLVTVSVWREPRDEWTRWALATGALGGLTMLARLDSGVVVLCLLGLIAYYQRGSRRWQVPGLALGTAAIVVAPWYLWSAFAVGTLVPVSGESATWLFREHYHAANPDAGLLDDLRYGRDYTESIFRYRIKDLYFPQTWFAIAVAIALAGLAAHFAFLASSDLRRKAAGWLLFVGAPLLGFVALLLYHTLYRWFFREWYFAWGMPVLAVLVGVLFAYACEAIGSLQSRTAPASYSTAGLGYALLAGTVVLFAFAYASPGRDAWRPGGFLAPQRDMLNAAAYLKANTDADARAASFNSGIIGYFSERTVLNIDGVVNPDAYDALREHRLLPYLRSRDVEYVVDRDMAWRGLPAFITPDDWSRSLWGEDPNAAMAREQEIGARFGFFGQMTVFRIER